MSPVVMYSTQGVLSVVFALLYLQIQIRLIATLWARGCTWRQAIDIYDLGNKYRNWMYFDIVANLVIMSTFSFMAAGFGWAATSPIILGLIGITATSAVALPIRCISARVAMKTNPNLLDFSGKYKATCEEYKKLVLLLDEKKLVAYKQTASNLWSELLMLNKRRTEAYKRMQHLETVKTDANKLISHYTVENETEKRFKAQSKLNEVIKLEAELEEFAKEVEAQIKQAESVFLDIRVKLEVGQLDGILPDLTGYTTKVKALEYTIDRVENI